MLIMEPLHGASKGQAAILSRKGAWTFTANRYCQSASFNKWQSVRLKAEALFTSKSKRPAQCFTLDMISSAASGSVNSFCMTMALFVRNRFKSLARISASCKAERQWMAT